MQLLIRVEPILKATVKVKHSVTARQLLQSDQEQAELMEQQEVPTMAQVPESELLEQFEERLLVVVVTQ